MLMLISTDHHILSRRAQVDFVSNMLGGIDASIHADRRRRIHWKPANLHGPGRSMYWNPRAKCGGLDDLEAEQMGTEVENGS
jgi:hypothetical protein